MTLAEVLEHVFTDKDLIKEVGCYSVTHTSTDNYTISVENGTLTIQVVKKERQLIV